MKNNKIRILAITHNFPRWYGDLPGNFILRLYTLLTDKAKIHVISPFYPGYKKVDNFNNIEIFRFSYGPEYMQRIAYEGDMLKKVLRNPLYSVLMLIFLYRMLLLTYYTAKRYKPSIIHAHWIFPGGVIAGIVSKNLHIPMLLSIHGTDLRLTKNNSLLRRLTRWLLRRTECVVTVSNYLALEVKTMFNGLLNVEAIPMPVETQSFFPLAERHPSEEMKIITVARLTKQKRLDILLKASRLLVEKGIEHKVQIIGDGSEKETLVNLSKELGTPVEFLGFQTQECVAEYMRKADIFVLPAKEEGFGLVVVEAMLSGLPPVLARSGAFTELIEHGRTGFLFHPDDPKGLAELLIKLIKNPELRHRISLNALQEAKKRFNQNIIADRYLRLMRWTMEKIR